MNKLVPKDIFVPVGVEEALPSQDQKTNFVIYGNNQAKGTLHKSGFEKWKVTHWLEKHQNRLVFTEGGLNMLLQEVWEAALKSMSYSDRDEYIENLYK